MPRIMIIKLVSIKTAALKFLYERNILTMAPAVPSGKVNVSSLASGILLLCFTAFRLSMPKSAKVTVLMMDTAYSMRTNLKKQQ